MPQAAGLYYEEHGSGEGAPLILSSGLGGSGNYWAPNLAALSDHHRVITYDHRGTGRSSRELGTRVSVEDFARDVLALMDALEIDRAHFVGHAAGGVAGLALALIAPDRLATLTVINGWSKPDPHFGRCFDARLALLRHAGPEAYLRAQPLFLYPADWCSRNQALLEAELPHQLAQFPGAETMEKRIAALRAFDIDDRLGEIRTPVLLISAGRDVLVPPLCSCRLEEGIAHAWHQTMSFEGHACNVTDPELFAETVLNFIGG